MTAASRTSIRRSSFNSKFEPAFDDRGFVNVCKGEYDNAIQDFDRAINLNPKFALAFYNRAHLYACKGEYGRAIQDLNQLITLEPTSAEAVEDRKFASAHSKPHCPPVDCVHDDPFDAGRYLW